MTKPISIFFTHWPKYKSGGILRDSQLVESSFEESGSFAVQRRNNHFQFMESKLYNKTLTILNILGFRTKLKVLDCEAIYLPQVGYMFRNSSSFTYIVRLHDLFPLSNPEWFRLIPYWNFKKTLNIAINSKNVIFLCNSQTTQFRLLNTFPEKSLKTIVYPCQVPRLDSESCSICSACKMLPFLPSNYLLMVGTIEPRKDYPFIFRVINEIGDKRLGVIVIGRVGWKCDEVSKLLENSTNFYWFQDSCDGSLRIFYQNAMAFISTSLDEGFNLPAGEAFQFGTPLLLRDIEVHREFHEGNAVFFSTETELINSIQSLKTRTQNKNFNYISKATKIPADEIIAFLD